MTIYRKIIAFCLAVVLTASCCTGVTATGIENPEAAVSVDAGTMASGPITITTQPESAAAEIGERVVFTIAATGKSLTYTWMVSKDDGSTWEEAFSDTYPDADKKPVEKAERFDFRTPYLTVWVQRDTYDYLYYCEVSDGSGNKVNSDIVAVENPSDVPAESKIEITRQPKNQQAEVGEKVVFTVEANGYHLKYTWMRSEDGGATWVKARYDGYLTPSMTVTVQKEMYDCLFYCQITDGNGNKAASNTVKIEKPPLVSSIQITKQPENQRAAIGQKAVFSIAATGKNLKYTWMQSNNGGTSWAEARHDGYQTSSMTVTVQRSVYDCLFYCKITDVNGFQMDSKTVKVEMPTDTRIDITKQPTDYTAAVGEKAVFSVEAKGTGLNYVWMVSKDSGKTWSKATYTGQQTSSMTVPVQEDVFAQQFYCQITDDYGNTVNTNTVKIIKKIPLVITKQPVDITAAVGEKAVLSVEATGKGVKYVWMVSKDSGKNWSKASYEGNQTSNMTVPVQEDVFAQQFYCQITDDYGNKVNTNTVKIIKKNVEPLVITKQPVNVTAAAGQKAVFTVEATGSGLKYQWKTSTDNGKTWTNSTHSGAATEKMTVTVTDAVFNQVFSCFVSDQYGATEQTNVVKVQKPSSGFHFAKDDSHKYKETKAGKVLISTDDFLTSTVSKYSISYKPAKAITVSSSDIMILRFTAKNHTSAGKVKVNINGTAYQGTYPVNTEMTEYYLTASGFSSISSVSIAFDCGSQTVDFLDVELLNYSTEKVYNLLTGMYNIEAANELRFQESQSIGSTAVAVLADDNYLYAIRSGTLIIYNLSNMNQVGTLSGLGSTRDLDFAKDGKYLVITSRENGAYFVDISNKNRPRLVSQYATLELATGLCVYDDYVFMCSRNFGVEIVDISDIANPKYVSLANIVNEEFYDCAVDKGYLYVSVWAQMRIEVFKLADIANPVHVNTVNTDGLGGGIAIHNGILYEATGYHNRDSYATNTSPGFGMGNGMDIFDLSNPENPVWLSTSKIDGRYQYVGFDHWRVKTDGHYAYLASIFNGVYIYDVSNPSAPKRVNHLVVHIDKSSSHYRPINQGTYVVPYDSLSFAQGMVAGITTVNGALYLSDLDTGTYVYKASYIGKEKTPNGTLSGTSHTPKAPRVPGYTTKLYTTESAVNCVAKNGSYYYIGCGNGTIQVLDQNMTLKSTIQGADSVRALAVVDQYLYAAECSGGIGVYSISGTTLRNVGRYKSSVYDAAFTGIELSKDGKSMLVQAGWQVVHVLDITNRQRPALLQSYTVGSMYYDNLASGAASTDVMTHYSNNGIFGYTVASGKVQQKFKVTNITVGERNGLANYKDGVILVYSDGYAYFNPTTLGSSSTISLKKITVPNVYLRGKPVVSGTTMVASYSFGKEIVILDISNISSPVLKAQFTVDGNPAPSLIVDGEILVPLKNGGLLRLK